MDWLINKYNYVCLTRAKELLHWKFLSAENNMSKITHWLCSLIICSSRAVWQISIRASFKQTEICIQFRHNHRLCQLVDIKFTLNYNLRSIQLIVIRDVFLLSWRPVGGGRLRFNYKVKSNNLRFYSTQEDDAMFFSDDENKATSIIDPGNVLIPEV